MPEQQDYAMRPLRLADYAGQDHIRRNLEVAVAAAKRRGEPLDHCLFYGPPGLGKTTLALIVAAEMGTQAHCVHAPNVEQIADLMPVILGLGEGDVLFIDEIHRLPAAVEEAIYPAVEDFVISIPIEDRRTVQMPLPRFTLVAATTRLGLVTAPLRSRFGIVEPLEFYPADVLAQIILTNAAKLGVTVTADGAAMLAGRARGTPRIANRILRRARDVAGNRPVDAGVAAETLEAMGIDRNGLDRSDRKYLKIIADVYAGGPVGIDAIAATLGESRDTVEDAVEPFLVQQAIVARTRRGRMLTDRGRSLVHAG